jgi:hypothetical protein
MIIHEAIIVGFTWKDGLNNRVHFEGTTYIYSKTPINQALAKNYLFYRTLIFRVIFSAEEPFTALLRTVPLINTDRNPGCKLL